MQNDNEKIGKGHRDSGPAERHLLSLVYTAVCLWGVSSASLTSTAGGNPWRGEEPGSDLASAPEGDGWIPAFFFFLIFLCVCVSVPGCVCACANVCV